MLKPPRTPPYWLILFYTISAVTLLVSDGASYLGWTAREFRWGDFCVSLIWAVVDLALIWIAGTYPLAEVLPAPNVAQQKDVRDTTHFRVRR